MKVNIGIDIGGTKVNMGLVDEDANILASKIMPTPPGKEPGAVAELVAREALAMAGEAGLSMDGINSIGVGVPGTADTKTGFVTYCPNLGWSDVPLGGYFMEHLGREVLVAQDARLAAWGETLYGAARGYADSACITLGTGIGCGLVAGGKIYNGGMNTAGELGHMVIIPNGRECACGRRGCLERYCSGTGMLITARERFPQKLTGSSRTEDIFDMAYAGDPDALKLIEDSVDLLALGVGALVEIMSPGIVVISGGMCTHEKLIIEPLRRKVYGNGYVAWARKRALKIEKAELTRDAPMIGASALYRSV